MSSDRGLDDGRASQNEMVLSALTFARRHFPTKAEARITVFEFIEAGTTGSRSQGLGRASAVATRPSNP